MNNDITVRLHESTPTIVVQGVTYKFSVFRGNENVTNNCNWTQIAEEATQIALTLVNKGSVKKANITLEGLPERVGDTLPENGVTCKSAKIKISKKKKKKFTSEKIRNQTRNIASHLKKIEEYYSRPENSLPEDKIPTIQVPDDGRCLDLSVAPLFISGNGSVDEKAELLRTSVSNELKGENNRFDTNPSFLGLLKASIEAIPAFAQNDLQLLQNQSQERFQQIKTLLAKEKLDSNEKKTLREFYAEYITEKGDDGKMKNMLDQAFLYILPQINSSWKIAVVSKDAITAVFPENAALNLQDWIFLYFDKKHYERVNKENQEAIKKLNQMIAVKNAQILDGFLNLLTINDNVSEGAPEKIKEALFKQLKTRHPTAFNALAYCMYKHDHTNWESSNQTTCEPGTEDSLVKGEYGQGYSADSYPGSEYGTWRLANLHPGALKVILKSFDRNAINQKIGELSSSGSIFL